MMTQAIIIANSIDQNIFIPHLTATPYLKLDNMSICYILTTEVSP